MLVCRGIPVFCNRLWRSRSEAIAAERGDLELRACGSCGMLYNARFDGDRVVYSEEYENAQHFSPRFRSYLDELAGDLIRRHGLENRSIVEIGCGDGAFLARLCAGGRNRGRGFDPAAPREGRLPEEGAVTIFRSTFRPGAMEGPVDLVCCRQVLEHLRDPVPFLRTLRESLGARECIVFFEVPDARFTLEGLGIWDLLYEHPSYFTTGPLVRLFATCGFEVLRTASLFEGQFLGLEARPSGAVAAEPDAPKRAPRGSIESVAAGFGQVYRRKVEHWRRRLGDWREDGRRVVVWGAGTKGVMFLNTVDRDGAVRYAVDVNVRKHGCFVSGTGQEIVPPERLREAETDVVLVMNPAYEQEIRTAVARVLGPTTGSPPSIDTV